MSQNPFGKIFRQMYNSTVAEDWRVMVVFQQLIVLANKDGIVDMTPESIARFTNIPLDIIKHGIKELEKPDKRSRGQEHGGARIVRIDKHRDWGWLIPRHKHYTWQMSDENNRIRSAERMRRYRERLKDQS